MKDASRSIQDILRAYGVLRKGTYSVETGEATMIAELEARECAIRCERDEAIALAHRAAAALLKVRNVASLADREVGQAIRARWPGYEFLDPDATTIAEVEAHLRKAGADPKEVPEEGRRVVRCPACALSREIKIQENL